MNRRRTVGLVAVAVVIALVVAVATRGNRAHGPGSTYEVTTEFVPAIELCSASDGVDVDGTWWFGIVEPDDGSPSRRRYQGTLLIVEEPRFEGDRRGIAQFTTGLTTVTFRPFRPCV